MFFGGDKRCPLNTGPARDREGKRERERERDMDERLLEKCSSRVIMDVSGI